MPRKPTEEPTDLHYAERVINLDHHFEMSDDYRTYKAGFDAKQRLAQELKELSEERRQNIYKAISVHNRRSETLNTNYKILLGVK